jgi:uncharacterized membrane protein YqgA involved in biofilm formation
MFHENLGFKKTKHDPDLWMVDKTSHNEYLATYVDDILIWSKDPMAVIKSLEKYLQKIFLIIIHTEMWNSLKKHGRIKG